MTLALSCPDMGLHDPFSFYEPLFQTRAACFAHALRPLLLRDDQEVHPGHHEDPAAATAEVLYFKEGDPNHPGDAKVGQGE